MRASHLELPWFSCYFKPRHRNQVTTYVGGMRWPHPIVGVSSSNPPVANRSSRLLFPTPLSPTRRICTSYKQMISEDMRGRRGEACEGGSDVVAGRLAQKGVARLKAAPIAGEVHHLEGMVHLLTVPASVCHPETGLANNNEAVLRPILYPKRTRQKAVLCVGPTKQRRRNSCLTWLAPFSPCCLGTFQS